MRGKCVEESMRYLRDTRVAAAVFCVAVVGVLTSFMLGVEGNL